jgi:hypothetical protein
VFTRRKIGGHNGNTGGDERTLFQMGAWVSFYEISRVRSRHVLSCDYSGIREAGRQAAARQARNKRTPEVQHPFITIVPASRIVWQVLFWVIEIQ